MASVDTAHQAGAAADPGAAADVTYGGYLGLDALLGTQHPLGPAGAGPRVYAAEHFFIVIHQCFELWFKQQILDFQTAAGALDGPDADPEAALDALRRATAIQRLLVQQMGLFDHLAPRDFLAFRDALGTASGADSTQYRVVQRALGLRGHESPVYVAFQGALARAGLTLEELYRAPSRGGALYRVAEALVDLAEAFWLCAALHVRIAERAIGARPGTGGTTGVAFLEETLKAKPFPELWAVRTRL
ncbi:MAG TPA: tryptophan 2,3-dioxygenase family protein [Thermomicrobiales bacterium]|nr:tryptophan 2,3-dioxygenase family protein [Thermomicrobiales bacterium]HEX5504177.1 tryptophan 2,3-dioxygenase family protein [Thermomicrobiales bacterium]